MGEHKEIEMDRSGHKELLVVDENAKVRFSSPWQLFREESMRGFVRKFGTAEQAWAEVKNTAIPDTFKRSVDEQ